jgi:hypothetical protein
MGGKARLQELDKWPGNCSPSEQMKGGKIMQGVEESRKGEDEVHDRR